MRKTACPVVWKAHGAQSPWAHPIQVAKRAAARGAKEGSMVVSTVKETAETPLRG
jgi:hypothetical protein